MLLLVYWEHGRRLLLIASLLLYVFVAHGTINRSLGLPLPSLVATLIPAGLRLVFKVIIISDTPAAEDEKIHVLQDPITLQEEEAAAPDRAMADDETSSSTAEHPITAMNSLEESLSHEITDEEREMVTRLQDLLEHFVKYSPEVTPDSQPQKIDLLLQCVRAQLDTLRQEPDPSVTPEMLTETLQAILTEAGINDADYLAKLHMQLYGVHQLFDAHAASTTPTAITQRIVEQCQKLARMALLLFAHHENPQLADT